MWKVALDNTGASLFPWPVKNNLGLESTVIRRVEMEINATSIHRAVVLSCSRQILLWLKKHLELGISICYTYLTVTEIDACTMQVILNVYMY